jgi:hypothetical protein
MTVDEANQQLQLVKVEDDPNPQFPSPRCLSPMRVHNYNDVPVLVTYTMYYAGEGPAQCQAQWASQETVRLERNGWPGAYRYLGCSQHSYEGSFCVERRSWQIESVQPTHRLAVDADAP